MANKNQPDRWESAIFACALALAGTLFVFDKLGSAAWISATFSKDFLGLAPVFLGVIGFSLMLADKDATPADRNQRP